MMKTVVKKIFRETDSFAGKEITLSGWVRNIRISKNFGFIELNDGTFFKNISGNGFFCRKRNYLERLGTKYPYI